MYQEHLNQHQVLQKNAVLQKWNGMEREPGQLNASEVNKKARRKTVDQPILMVY